jgi:hypothetical protein
MEDSVEQYLGSLESEDLERVADQIRDLVEHPGWAHLIKLAEVYERKAVSQMLVLPKHDAAEYAHAAGRILGVRRFMGLESKVRNKRELVRRAIAAREA